jgi:Skp family chaperone for outer membrane proteins
MTSKFLRVLLAVAVLFTVSALAQTGSAAVPSAPSASSSASTPAVPPPITGTKVGAINIEGAIFGCNEGQRDVAALQKKFEPKQNELKGQNDELEALKKQLNDQGPKLNEDALATLKKQIETKQKVFDRAVQDAQEEFGTQQQEIGSRILNKIAPLIVSYARDNGFGMIIDTSKPWPQGPVLLAGESMDITKAIVDAYNEKSGIAAPAAAKPAAPKSGAATTPKPAPKPAETPKQ